MIQSYGAWNQPDIRLGLTRTKMKSMNSTTPSSINPYRAYEIEKAKLPPMSPTEYEQAVRELADKYKI